MQPPAEIRENTTLLANGTAGCPKWQCCLKSNAALLILVWNLCIATGLEFFSFYPAFPGIVAWTNIMRMCLFGVSAIFLFFYILAGYLADARWGRYTTILGSLRFFLISAIMIFFLGILGACGSLAVALTTDHNYPYESLGTLKIVSIIVLCLIFGLPMLFGIFLIIFSLIAFSANVIQYGTDQLEYDARSENIILYIYWYVWTCYVAKFIIRIMITLFGIYSCFINPFICLMVLPIIISVTFCVKQCNIHFVNTQPQSDNPYNLIYQIIVFIVNHMHLHSHVNHNEPRPSSRLDFGKQRYGGPFTSNQVEAVKSFLRIFCILLTLGPVLMVDMAVSQILPSLIPHMDRYPSHIHLTVIAPDPDQKYDVLKSLISSGALTPLVVVVALPIYICLLQPCLYKYILGALKRIGIGMVFIFLSALCTLIVDTFGHIQTANKNVTTCFLNTNYYYDDPYYNIVPY